MSSNRWHIYTRGSREEKFVEHIRRHHINPQTVAAMTGSTLPNHPGAHLTGIGIGAPVHSSLVAAPADSQPAVTAWALEAILGDMYRERVAALVKKTLPADYVGVSVSERAARADKLGKERSKIAGQVEELESSLAALGIVAAAPTTAGSDEDHRTARERAQAFVSERIDSLIGISPTKAVDQVEAAFAAGNDPHEALSAGGAL
jgi:hypothetical protein